MTRLRRATPVAAALVLALALLRPATAQAASPLSIPVAGTVNGASGTTFSGVFNLTSFAVRNGQLVAVGTLSGVITTAVGGVITVVGSVLTTVALPVFSAS